MKQRGQPKKVLFIVGAGFSFNAGVPLASEFTRALLKAKTFARNKPSRLMMTFLDDFVRDVFRIEKTSSEHRWPQLEDLFTTIDLAANSGHFLGNQYSPRVLRTVRRALLVRTIRMLYQTHSQGEKVGGPSWELLKRFFARVSASNSAFLSMNWDMVIEEGVAEAQGIEKFIYHCEERRITLRNPRATFDDVSGERAIEILKPHGSANWVYCDSCRQLFYVSPTNTDSVAQLLFRKSDWEILADFVPEAVNPKTSTIECPDCQADALGTRFATFSYRKALDFPMHARSWLRAEQLLRDAEHWIFIGYSLPPADFEFKHLLKHVQLSRRHPPTITMITGGNASRATTDAYRRFLGTTVETFEEGLSDQVLAYLINIHALNKRAYNATSVH